MLITIYHILFFIQNVEKKLNTTLINHHTNQCERVPYVLLKTDIELARRHASFTISVPVNMSFHLNQLDSIIYISKSS